MSTPTEEEEGILHAIPQVTFLGVDTSLFLACQAFEESCVAEKCSHGRRGRRRVSRTVLPSSEDRQKAVFTSVLKSLALVKLSKVRTEHIRTIDISVSLLDNTCFRLSRQMSEEQWSQIKPGQTRIRLSNLYCGKIVGRPSGSLPTSRAGVVEQVVSGAFDHAECTARLPLLTLYATAKLVTDIGHGVQTLNSFCHLCMMLCRTRFQVITLHADFNTTSAVSSSWSRILKCLVAPQTALIDLSVNDTCIFPLHYIPLLRVPILSQFARIQSPAHETAGVIAPGCLGVFRGSTYDVLGSLISCTAHGFANSPTSTSQSPKIVVSVFCSPRHHFFVQRHHITF